MPDLAAQDREDRLRDMYLDVVRKAVQHTLYHPMDTVPPPAHVVAAIKEALHEARRDGTLDTKVLSLDPRTVREQGHHNDAVYAQTMTSTERLLNVRTCVETILREGVAGDLIEAGVWRGGIPIFMRAVLAAHGVEDRQVVLADSFQGLPPADPETYPADGAFDEAEAGRFSADVSSVEANFAAYGLLDERVELVPGWFSDSLPGLADRTWALIRLDGDLYGSTWDCLVNLYPRLSPGGFVIIDDWVLPPCRAAVEDYRAQHGIDDEIVEIDWASVYWRRSG